MFELLATLESDLRIAEAARNVAYWAFTRTARGKPVPASLTREVYRLRDAVARERIGSMSP